MIYKFYIRAALSVGLVSLDLGVGTMAAEASLVGRGYCHLVDLEVFRDGYERLSREVHGAKQMTVVASLSAKPLHNLLVDGGASVEHLSQVLSFFFQKHMYEAMAGVKSLTVTSSQSVFFKMIRLQISMGENDRVVLQSMAGTALDAAVDDMVNYLLYPGGAVESMIRKQMANPSAFGFTPVFSENQTKILALDSSTLAKVRATLKGAFPGNELKAKFSEWYSTGAGLNNADAHSFLKIRSLQALSDLKEIVFDPVRLEDQLDAILSQRARLDWLFKGKDQQQVEAIFAIIRRNLDAKSTEDFSPDLKALLRTAPTLDNASPDVALLRPFAMIEEYVRRLNILDFLPEGRLIVDQNAREAFRQLPHPTSIVFVDFVNIGAKNLGIMHRTSEVLLSNIKVLREKTAVWIGLENSGASASAIEAAKNAALASYLAFMRTREGLLLPTDAYIQGLRQDMLDRFASIGLKKENFVLWSSGDDSYVVVNDPSISGERIATAIKTMPHASTRLRAGYANLKPGTLYITLDATRAALGPLADVLKFSEQLHPDYLVVAEQSMRYEKRVKLLRIDDEHRIGDVDSAMLTLLRRSFFETNILTASTPGPF